MLRLSQHEDIRPTMWHTEASTTQSEDQEMLEQRPLLTNNKSPATQLFEFYTVKSPVMPVSIFANMKSLKR